VIRDQLERNIFDRFARMEARPEMWASTREAFGFQLVTFVDMLLWPDEDPPRGMMAELMKRLFGPGPIVSTEPIDLTWARQAVGAARGFIEEKRSKPSNKIGVVCYGMMKGQAHDAYRDLISALGGPCRPEVVGWCDVEVDGHVRPALVVTQAWPFLPLGTDPRPIKKAQKHVALIPEENRFRAVEVPWPPPAEEST
jgi:hypothetical protein